MSEEYASCPGTVLVVDDNPVNLKLLTDMLGRAGYRVRPSISGEMALRSARAKPPDLVLMDIVMPGMDGIEACRRLKADPSTAGIPVLFISALSTVEEKLRAFEAGGEDYVVKPIEEPEVLARVATHLQIRNMRRQLARQNELLEHRVCERTAALQSANEELREREAKYRGVIEAQADGFWMTDPEGRLLEVNDAYVRCSGYSREELLAMRISDLEARESTEETAAHVRKVMSGGSDLFETLHRRRNGTVWQAEIDTAYLPIAEGRFCVFIRDIRQRKRAESLWRVRMQLTELAREGTLDDLLQSTLDLAELYTGSRVGFLHFVAPDQENLVLQAWSSNTLRNMCQSEGKGLHYPISQAGVWVDCFHRREPVAHNDYASLTHRKGLPEGHAPVVRMLTVPVVRKGLVVAIVGVGNKPADYVLDDAEWLQDLAEMAMDVLDRKQAELKLHLAASVFAGTQEAILITDLEGNILEVNPAFTQLTGYTREEALGRNPRILKSGRHEAEFYAAIWQALLKNGVWSGEIWNRKKDGTLYPEWLTISTIHDELGQPSKYIGAFSDITLLKQQEQQLEYLAYFDPLTGIPNRTLLADRMSQAIAHTRRQECLFAVGYLDLDAFKQINDRFGHPVGDSLLIEISQRIVATLREGDTVARLGGDEFVVLLLGLEKTEECLATLSRLLARIAEPLVLHDQCLAISASIGVSLYPLDDADPDTLLRHADQAMYQAKQAGKNRIQIYDPIADSQIRTQQDMLGRIETALENREFILFYQPKVDLRSGQVIGVEALIRWLQPERGPIPPGEFLHLVESHPLGQALDFWVMEEALRQLTLWSTQGLDLSVSVNVTAQTLQAPEFAERLAGLLASYPAVQPDHYELEILETAALNDLAYIAQVMRDCQALGVRFALDDFGTGYSSLSYLRHLPAEIVKIDQSFIRDMLVDEEDLAIVRGVIGLTLAFRRRAIAEGVETVEHGIHLIRLGCDLAQGYGIAKPMPAELIPEWVKDWKAPDSWG
jgi:diguanylate cyclase (GGDEF)-like protein/PAS domain S-box-containing protein